MIKNLPKSLHTVTVLQNVARLILSGDQSGGLSVEAAVDRALDALGFAESTDTYSLAEQASRGLRRENSK